MNTTSPQSPGIASAGGAVLVPRASMSPSAIRLRDAYARVPGAPLYQTEFGYYCLDEWARQGMPADVPLAELFGYDAPASHSLGQLGWVKAPLYPLFDTIVLEDRGEHEVVQDEVGRHVLFFKGRRSGFMPEYVDHPVKDRRTWEEDVKWRLDPTAAQRVTDLAERMAKALSLAEQGIMIVQNVIGGYMLLRSLIGPSALPYAFYDMPDVLHDIMATWLALADVVTATHQRYVTFDELFFGEDICYNHGLLISPRMVREFILPYYQQLIANIKRRQKDAARHLYVHVDTDGFAAPAIPVYQDIGMDMMSPFEVASGCDVVAIGRAFPDLVIKGGIDKRVLAESPEAIDRHLEYILPAMRARGGYVPTCDHGVPAEVPYEYYLHYRRRARELGLGGN